MTSVIPTPLLDITNIGNKPGEGPLRAGGQDFSSSMANPTAAALPSTYSAIAERQQPGLAIVRDLWEGTMRVREEQEAYLPRGPGEEAPNYKSRLARSVFFNVFKQTILGLMGQIFRKDPVLGDDVPKQIVDLWDNIDNAGTHGDVFVRDISTDAECAGHAAILVEYPNTGGTQSAADELRVIRPYWVPIRKDDIISWRTDVEHGKTELTQLVLREMHLVPNGPFGEQPQVRYRIFVRNDTAAGPLISWHLLQITADQRVLTVDEGTYPTLDEIPVAELSTSGRRGLFDSEPPLLDLGLLNIAHYQQWSDTATSLHMTCVPILGLFGFEQEVDGSGQPINKMVIGSHSALRTSNANAKAEYISHSGAAISECRAALNDLVSYMGSLGLSMLSPSKRTAETAQAKKLDKSSEDSALSVTARGLEDGVEHALDITAKYLKLPDGGSFHINREFEDQTMQSDMLVAYVQAVAQAGLPVRVLTEAMQDGGLIAPDADLDSLDAQMMANAKAVADQKAQQLKDSVKLLSARGANLPPPAPPGGMV